MKLDVKDRKIISMYAEDPNVSQDHIASELGITQPSVAMRVKKLRDAGAIENLTGIDPFKMELHIAKVDIATSDPGAILSMFRNCPYFAQGFTVSGKHNLSMLFISENIATLEAIVNGHIRKDKSVTDIEFNIIISSEKKFVVPTILTPDRSEKPPCGVLLNCRDCTSFKEGKCMGCPVTGQYQGWFY